MHQPRLAGQTHRWHWLIGHQAQELAFTNTLAGTSTLFQFPNNGWKKQECLLALFLSAHLASRLFCKTERVADLPMMQVGNFITQPTQA